MFKLMKFLLPYRGRMIVMVILLFLQVMGTAGAAIATGVSQTFAFLIMLTHFIRRKGILRFHCTKLEGSLFRKIALRGLPEGIGQLATPVTTFCMNRVLISQIGTIGVNAFSVISYVASFTAAVFFGTSEGLQPLFGQSYSAKHEKDLKFYFRIGLCINLIDSAAVTGLILLLSRPICSLFGADAQTVEYVLETMPKYSWGFLVMAVNVMISAYLYSTKRSGQAITINLLRSVVMNVAIIFLLPALLGGGAVWFAFGIYEAIVLVVAFILLRHSERSVLFISKGGKQNGKHDY